MKKQSAVIHSPRAMQEYRLLSGALKTFLVENDESAPLIKRGEYAVVDTDDRSLVHDEVFLVDTTFGERERRLVVVTAHMDQITRKGPKQRTWWTRCVAGWHRSGTTHDGIPVFVGLSEGPMSNAYQKMVVGKVVGIAHAPLGGLLPRSRGWLDEESNNARFSAGAYVDALLAANWRVEAVLKADGTTHGWVEYTPEEPSPHPEERHLMKMRERLARASSGKKRVVEELMTRGLYMPRASAA